MQTQKIDKAWSRYRKYSVWVTTALALTGIVVYQVWPNVLLAFPHIVSAIVFTTIFFLVASEAYAAAWRAVAKASPANLTRFYLVAATLKMLASAVVFLIGVLVIGKAEAAWVAVVFLTFYVAHLLLDGIYFSRWEKGQGFLDQSDTSDSSDKSDTSDKSEPSDKN